MMNYMSDIEAIEYLEKTTNTKFSEEQKNILMHRGGMNISACAGSGKTTILIYLLAKRILTGEIIDTNKVLCTTYSKSGATEMGDRLKKLFNTIGLNCKLEIRTQHAFYYSILRRFGLNASVLDSATRLKYIAEACKYIQSEHEKLGITVEKISYDDYLELDRLFSFQSNNIMNSDELVASYTYNLEHISKETYDEIRTRFQKTKSVNNVLDFDDMQVYIYKQLCVLKNQTLIHYCHFNWDEFYVDEAQDISKIQFAILKEMMANGNKLVFIGDDDQCIYQWRGADPNIILNINGYYDIARFVLPTNYRCKSEIVNHAAIGIKNNTKRSNKTMRPFIDGGKIEILPVQEAQYDMDSYAEVIYNKVMELVNKGEKLSNIAVLSRNNQSLPAVMMKLIENGIFCTFPWEGRATKQPYFADILQILSLLNSEYDADKSREVIMKTCGLFRHRKLFIQNLYDLQFSRGLKIQEALCYTFDDIIGYGSDYFTDRSEIHVNLEDKSIQNLRLNFYKLSENERKSLDLLTRLLDNKHLPVDSKISCILDMYLESNQFRVKNNKDSDRIMRGYISFAQKALSKHGLVNTIETFNIIDRYIRGYYSVSADKVELSTIHSAKGKEWRNVFILSDDTLSFPNYQSIQTMLDHDIKVSDISDFLDEERRLHYVAMTRAKENLFITTIPRHTSPFLLEALGDYKNPNDNNMEIIKMGDSGYQSSEAVKAETKALGKFSLNENEEEIISS